MKKNIFTSALILCLLVIYSGKAEAQNYPKRQDVVWAKGVGSATITLDGKLDEDAWKKADSITLTFGNNGSLPTSGYRAEFQVDAVTDPTHATVKFLSSGKYLYMAFSIPDSSIGGTKDWARWDAILMGIINIASSRRPAPPVEFFYTWWMSGLPDSISAPYPGCPPRFVGTYGNYNGLLRDDTLVAVWDGKTVVDGLSDDAGKDKSWTTEMRIDVSKLGYDLTKAAGETVLLALNIWDCDGLFDGKPDNISATRTWWQSPWGNNYGGNIGRVCVSPSVNISSGDSPEVAPDIIVPCGDSMPEPVIDGTLDEATWKGAYSFNMAWDDSLVRASYPGPGKYLSGQYRPDGKTVPVLDPSYANIKMFFRGDYLYIGADINDQLVQGTSSESQFDGIRFTINDMKKTTDGALNFHQIRLHFDNAGTMLADEELHNMVDSGYAWVATKLKGATTINKNDDVDEGYTIELKIDLKRFGYTSGLPEKLLFMGANLFDGDSFDDATKNYGTQTWWFTEYANRQCVPWMVMDKNSKTAVEYAKTGSVPASFELKGNYPNPFNPSTKINYSLPSNGDVSISVYNSLGQLVSRVAINSQNSGQHSFNFNASGLTSGVYLYQVTFRNQHGTAFSKTAKMMILK
jgi:hypothetical protein